MKKIFYFTILTFMVIPFVVKAETDLEEIHNSISEDNEITVKSIPLEQYKDSEYFKTCMNKVYSPTEEQCLSEIFGEIVVSKIKTSVEIPKSIDVRYQNCDIENNTCEILVRNFGFNQAAPVIEDYKINFEEEEISNRPSKIKTKYKMYDLGYINQTLNYGTIESYFNEIQQSSKIFKMYPGLKEEMEKNRQFDFVVGTTSGASGEFKYGAVARLVSYYEDVAVDLMDINYNTYRILFISEETPKTKEAYIKEAERRIKEYINDDSYEIKVEFDEVNNYDYCEVFDDVCVANDVFNEGDSYSFEMYKLYINGKYYELDLMPVPSKEIRKLSINSKDFKNDISVETESADVPLDTSVKAEDLTIKYKGYLKAYDIDLYSGIKDEYITKVKDGIIVKMPLPDNYDKNKLEIYHIKEDGTKGEKYKATVEEINGKKYAVFTTDHFSTYAIEESVEVPNTYDGIGIYFILLFTSLIGLIGLNIYSRKKFI